MSCVNFVIESRDSRVSLMPLTIGITIDTNGDASVTQLNLACTLRQRVRDFDQRR